MTSRYDTWMRRQPVDFQDDVLGPRAAALFRGGRLPLRRHRSRAGDALTVDQMRSRDAATAAFDNGQFPTVAFINLAKTPLGFDLDEFVRACQKYLDTIFTPVWGFPARLLASTKPVPKAWSLLFLENADAADALGYHDLSKDGLPVSKVFVQDCIDNDAKIGTTASHELTEMLMDPGAQLWAQNGDSGDLYAYETGDAVEDEEFQLDGMWMSDFVYPAFFEDYHKPGSVQFDYLKQVDRPFQTLKGGYQIVMHQGKIITELASKTKERSFAEEDRRYHRSSYRRAFHPSLGRGEWPVRMYDPNQPREPAGSPAGGEFAGGGHFSEKHLRVGTGVSAGFKATVLGAMNRAGPPEFLDKVKRLHVHYRAEENPKNVSDRCLAKFAAPESGGWNEITIYEKKNAGYSKDEISHTVAHEMGHGIDQSRGYSNGEQFKNAVAADIAGHTPGQAGRWSYYRGSYDWQFPRGEPFAESVASLVSPMKNSEEAKSFKLAFPRTVALVEKRLKNWGAIK